MNTKEWITLLGAVIAAITGLWNLWIQVRGKRDRLLVKLGTLQPEAQQFDSLYVVNLSDHPVHLYDWGLIEGNGKFFSFNFEWDIGNILPEEIYMKGERHLEKFGNHFESGCERETRPIGAYAISITQKRPTVYFAYKTPRWKRALLRMRLLFDTGYLGY